MQTFKVKIAGLWELGWNTPIKEIELWEYPLRDYDVNGLIMAPVSGIANNFVTERHDLSVALDEHRQQGYQVVFVDEKGTTDLAEYTHPTQDTIYVFGKASLSPLAAYSSSQDQSVRITTKNNLATLWPHQAAVLVLHDRMAKGL